MKLFAAAIVACVLASACGESNPLATMASAPSALSSQSEGGGVFSPYVATDPRYSCPHPLVDVSERPETNGSRSVTVVWNPQIAAASFRVEIMKNLTTTLAGTNNGPLSHIVDGAKFYDTLTGLDQGTYWARLTSKSCDVYGTPSAQTELNTFTITYDGPPVQENEHEHGWWCLFGELD